MPIYEYQCEKCGYIFEEVSFKFNPTKISTECPSCKEKNIKGISKRIISKSAFIVNGFNSNNGYAGNQK